MANPIIKEILIVKVEKTETKKFGFGKILETNENVFIPPYIINRHDLAFNDKVFGDVIPNTGSKLDNTPWRLEFIYDTDGAFAHLLPKTKLPEPVAKFEPKVVVAKEPSREELLMFIQDHLNKYPTEVYTTQEMADEIEAHLHYKMQTSTLGRDMDYLFKIGRLAKFQAYSTVSNQRAARVVWTSQLKALSIFDRMIELYEAEELRQSYGQRR